MSPVLNVDDCSPCQCMPGCSVLGTWFKLFHRDTSMFDRLFEAVLVLPSWAALVPVSLHEDFIEELMWHMRAVHSDHMACPAKP